MEEYELLESKKYLAFTLEEEVFAFDIAKVREVVEFTTVTKVPQTPAMMKGIINLRGGGVPVIDFRIKFDMEETEITVNTVIIIIEIELEGEINVIGIVVDSVKEVIDLDSEHIEPPPKIGNKLDLEFITGMGKKDGRFVIILDIKTIFTSEELEMVQQISEQIPA